MTTWRSFENDRIDMHAIDARTYIIKQTMRAYCWLDGRVSHELRSLAHLRRDRVAEKLNKRGAIK